MRLTEEEIEKFEALARARGMRLGPWLRLLAYDELDRRAGTGKASQ